MKNKKVYLYILGVLLLFGWFYWFEYRPIEIRRYCAEEATKEFRNTQKNNRYRECIAKRGLKPESIYNEEKTDTSTYQLDTSLIESEIEDLRNSLEEQEYERQEEYQSQIRCESNGGRYQGNSACIYDF